MGISTRRGWQAVWLLVAVLLAPTAWSEPLSVSRLDADPVPEQVIAGEFDPGFIAVAQPVILERTRLPRWWRVTARAAIAGADSPHLVVRAPHLNQIEAWPPGQAHAVRRALYGANADPDVSTRALVVPLPDGLAAGQSVYLRVHAANATPMRVSVEPLSQVHRADRVHIASRTIALTSLLVLAVLALGFWLAIGQRRYAYLFLMLLTQVGFLAIGGGEVRLLPGVADLVAGDVRVVRITGLLGMVASIGFAAQYLELRTRQPGLMRVFDGCSFVLVVLLLASLFSTANRIAVIANVTLLIASATAFAAAVIGALQRQRAAVVLLLSWLPVIGLLWMSVGELFGLWINPAWFDNAFPAGFVLSGFIITIGLSDTMQQLRRDRDRASQIATVDMLTGAMTRPAVEAGLKAAVAEAHRTGRPMSVVFFDIDRFKLINDEHGHRIGDSCLRIIGLRTRNRLRTYDLFGRFGGDEILVVLPNTRLAEALGVAENLRSAVNCRPLSIDGLRLRASLSLGVAELTAGESAEHLLERADEALYASKAAGRDRVTGHNSRVTATRLRVQSPQV